jgi:hypothetical protein
LALEKVKFISVYPEIKNFQMELKAVSDQPLANPLLLKVIADSRKLVADRTHPNSYFPDEN